MQDVSLVPYGVIADQVLIKVGLPDSALVCVITEVGSFATVNPKGHKATGTIGFRVLDARTGNLLAIGFRQTLFRLTAA